MKSRAKCLLQIAVVIAAIPIIAAFCTKQTDGFSLLSLESRFPNDPNLDFPSDMTELEGVLDQKYHYLDFGGQCHVFESEDQQYVIKLLSHKFGAPQALLMSIPLPEPLKSKRAKMMSRIFSKHARDYHSYWIAYEILKEETGLIYVHLNTTENLQRQLTITDKLHIAHQIDLDNTAFIVQKKAALVYPTINTCMQNKDVEGAKQALHAIIDVIVQRCQKGIFDEDPRIHCNVGLIGGRAILIDVGRFKGDANRKNPDVYKKDLSAITARFKEWLSKNHPALVTILEEELEKA